MKFHFRSAFMWRRLIAVVLVLFISGCSTTSRYNPVPLLSSVDNQAVDKGVVVVRVINVSAGRYPFNEINFVPKNFNQSKEVKIQEVKSKPTKSGHSMIFAGAIKPGSYSLSSLGAFYHFGNYYYANGVKAEVNFGTFNVEPNKVTDLGTIIYYPKAQEETYVEKLIRLPMGEPGKLIDQHFSFFNYDKSAVLTWDEDGFADERESTYLSAAQNPVSFAREYLADDGHLYILAKLGVILHRTPDGEWLVDAVDTNLALRSIAKNAKGDILVGGDEGTVFVKHNGSEQWQDISIGHEFDVQEVAFDDQDNMLLFVIRDRRMGLYKSEENISGLTPNWQVVKFFTTGLGWKTNDGNNERWWVSTGANDRLMNAELEKSENGQILSVYHKDYSAGLIIGETYSTKYRTDLNTLTFNLLPKSNKVDVVINAGAVQIGIKKAGFWSWTGKPDFFIKNSTSGAWRELEMKISIYDFPRDFYFLSTPWFSDSKNGVSIAKIDKEEKPKIITSSDGGITWKKTDYKLPKDYCLSLVSAIKDRLLLSCDGATGDFYESTDNGKTWEHVREHEDF